MKIKASLNNLRISPRKVRLVARLIKGLGTQEALVQLEQVVKRSGQPIEKLVKSAIANAENNFGLDRENLYIYDVQIGEGPTLKRWLPRAFGRATMLLKRTSKVYLTLEEKEEGKNRKSKQQLEKERKDREAARKQLEAEMLKERDAEEGEEKIAKEEKAPLAKKGKKEAQVAGSEKGWAKKIFQRKSA